MSRLKKKHQILVLSGCDLISRISSESGMADDRNGYLRCLVKNKRVPPPSAASFTGLLAPRLSDSLKPDEADRMKRIQRGGLE